MGGLGNCPSRSRLGVAVGQAAGSRRSSAPVVEAAGGDMKDIQETLGHSSLTVSADVYTSLLPEFDRAIAERAALLVPRASRANGPNGAPPSEALAEPVGPSAHASLTQAAPDAESEAVDDAPRRPKLQVIQGGNESPLSDSNRRPSLYKRRWDRDRE
ncbi:hypothetical protein [Streptomyces sp. H39-S7]|uniref:hypothetical protein n=1 Tax=Streptomyces sp. H39-S7 TaxID=3004357 RepID=UPI003FA7B154